MKPGYTGRIALASILLGACAVSPGRAGASAPEFNVTASKAEDIITISDEEGTTVIDVESPFGIGSARIDLLSGSLPEKMIARLHLMGLEEFRLAYADRVIFASAASGAVTEVGGQRIQDSGMEQPIAPGHPLWLEVQFVSAPGYFEIAFPEEFSQRAGESFEIQWVDFFRQ
ncbi:MAG: hypothetical protein FJZ87_11785 [Chloroflexi bacterium]|nr:hypothetical protein [Chloroflexota bacterium]